MNLIVRKILKMKRDLEDLQPYRPENVNEIIAALIDRNRALRLELDGLKAERNLNARGER